MENIGMNPWTRIDQELSAKKRNWKWLAQELGVSEQTVNHWEQRGVPAKHHHAIEDVLGKAPRWVIDGVEEVPAELSDMALNLATLFDMIPKSSLVARSRAYNLAFDAIRKELPDELPIG